MKAQIVHAYAGCEAAARLGGLAPGLISRDHSAPVSPPSEERPFPVISLVRGMWTTYRAFRGRGGGTGVLTGSAPRAAPAKRPLANRRGTRHADDARGAARAAGLRRRHRRRSRARAARLLERYGRPAGRRWPRRRGRRPSGWGTAPTASGNPVDRAGREGRAARGYRILRRTDLAITAGSTRAWPAASAALAGRGSGAWKRTGGRAELEDPCRSCSCVAMA